MRGRFILVALIFITFLCVLSYFFYDYKVKGVNSRFTRLTQRIYSYRKYSQFLGDGNVVYGKDIDSEFGNCSKLPYVKFSDGSFARLVTSGVGPKDWIVSFNKYIGANVNVDGRISVNLYCKLRKFSTCGCENFLFVNSIKQNSE